VVLACGALEALSFLLSPKLQAANANESSVAKASKANQAIPRRIISHTMKEPSEVLARRRPSASVPASTKRHLSRTWAAARRRLGGEQPEGDKRERTD
jgi:hypothetical protein